MKKSSLTASVIAGLAGVAGLVNVSSALNVNPDGLGQVLIYPYYTVNGGNATLISVVNTTDETKAVKVRFLEGRNSAEVLDFNLYLSPFDVWTGGVVDNGDPAAPAQLITQDTSCTVPAIVGAVPFKDEVYRNTDEGPYGLARTREGHLEIIEMAIVTNPTYQAYIKHNTAGVPANCAAVQGLWRAPGGAWVPNGLDGQTVGTDSPTGGLFGGAEIVNVAGGTNLSYNADAIEGFYISESGQRLHYNPGDTRPNLGQAQSGDGAGATAVIFDNGTLVQLPFTGALAGRNAVSAVLSHNEIYNEYSTGAATAALSEWVITFPTKRLHISQPTALGKLPFTSTYRWITAQRGAPESIAVEYYDREEGNSSNQPEELCFSPCAPGEGPDGLTLNFEAQVITFNQGPSPSGDGGVGEVLTGNDASAILGSYYARNLDLFKSYTAGGDGVFTPADVTADVLNTSVFSLGWVRMTIGNPATNFLFTEATSATDPNILVGLPVTGFWAATYTNGSLDIDGVQTLSNYGGIHKHRADRDAVTGTVNTTDLTYTEFSGS